MISYYEAKVGDKVYYQPPQYNESYPEKYENGMIKEIPEGDYPAVRVVYHCANDWDNFKDYTSALTRTEDLYMGWKH